MIQIVAFIVIAKEQNPRDPLCDSATVCWMYNPNQNAYAESNKAMT